MLERRWQRLWLAYGLLGIWFLIWVWESSLSHIVGDIRGKNPYTHQEECTHHNITLVVLWQVAEIFKNYGGAITAIATAFIAWFTFTLRQSTDKLWGVTKAMGDRQSQDTEILQRAYLAVEPWGINPYRADGTTLSCDLVIVNAGNLPAQKVSWRIERGFSTERWLVHFLMPKKKVGDVLIPPRGRTIRSSRPLPRAELKSEETKAKGKLLWLYVWGRVDYNDGITKKRRFIEFCHRYNMNTVGIRGVVAQYGRQHEYGHRTDEG